VRWLRRPPVINRWFSVKSSPPVTVCGIRPRSGSSCPDLGGEIGVTVAGRAAAISQHVLEMPAPVVADALTYHYVTTAKLAAKAGSDWSRYAAGDRTRSPTGWTPRRKHDAL
jgi:hypothetical protein